MELPTSKSKNDASLAGMFFILAAVSSVVGLKLYDPILADADFLAAAGKHHARIVLGAISELVLVAAASGTGIMLYPYLRRYNESLGIGYLVFRLLEVVFILIGTLSVLAVLSIAEFHADGTLPDRIQAQTLSLSFIALHKWTFILGPNFMLAINTCIYSYVFYRTALVPAVLSKAGLASSCFIMLAAILEMFGVIQQLSVWGIVLALPIAAYEMSLAAWLLRKGLNNPLPAVSA